MAFTLPDLPYAHDALASKGMSAETLEFHHDLHHNAYVTNGNAAIAGTEWEGKSLEEIIVGTYDASSVAQNGIFNNISQLWNHNQFWEMMGENARRIGVYVGRKLRLCGRFQIRLLSGWCRSIRLRLVLAREKRRWVFGGNEDGKRREPIVLWSNCAARM